jgi:outer membrane protein OmpU
MKKSLLATTAIAALGVVGVASSAAAEGFEAKVNGYMEQYIGFSDNSSDAVANANVWNQNSDVEFYISGKQTLDNGLTVGFQIEMEGETPTSNDEQYAYIEGSFGKIIMGSENPAAYLMHLTVKSNGVGVEENDGAYWVAGAGGGSLNRTNIHSDVADDANTVTYLSPSVNGIQIGASFVPQAQTDTRSPGSSTNTQRTNDGVRDDGYSLGVSYGGSLNDVSLKLSAGYSDGGNDSSAVGDNTAFTAGIQVGFGGFTVSGAMASGNNDSGSTEYNNVAASLAYGAGPMGVSVVYLGANNDQGNDKQDIIELGASYALGAGVKAQASIYNVTRKTNGNTAANGTAGVAGIRLDF